MGALHEGHLSLIRQGTQMGAPVVVSIFVNPTQFAPHEDFDQYPRPLDRDLDMAAKAGAAAVFVPAAECVYPPDVPVAAPSLPPVATTPGLEDGHRPHFFTGVCAVVARLFDLVRPAKAIFGEKDWQQLQVIRAMVAADPSRFPLQIDSGPTLREADGLAMSSRNAYLDPAQRDQALALSRALGLAQGLDPIAAEAAMMACLVDAGLTVDYAVVRDAVSLGPPSADRPSRALIAASLGSIRLIDNGPV